MKKTSLILLVVLAIVFSLAYTSAQKTESPPDEITNTVQWQDADVTITPYIIEDPVFRSTSLLVLDCGCSQLVYDSGKEIDLPKMCTYNNTGTIDNNYVVVENPNTLQSFIRSNPPPNLEQEAK